MKLAVTYENGQVFQHFGHSKQFKLYEIGGGRVLSSEVVDTGSSGHGALAGLLKSLGAEALICGGIGGGAKAALAEAGISLYPGVTGEADAAAASFAAGTLSFDPSTSCSHHEEGHSCGDHGEGHSCGNHSCGSHEA